MTHLTKQELIEKLSLTSGLIPVGIDLENHHIEWLDMGKYHFYESFFRQSLDLFMALNKNADLVRFYTDIDVLDDKDIPTDFIYPTGFIFSVGRSGSTLLSKTLARSRDNLVFSEAPPHNQVISYLTENGHIPLKPTASNQAVFKNLVLTMARRRLPSHRNNIIKFTSYNIRFYDFIKSVFPGVPAIFVYREPQRVVASGVASPASWKSILKGKKLELIAGFADETLGPIEFEQKSLANLYQAGLDAKDIFLLNYESITPENLAGILSLLAIRPGDESLAMMSKQFDYYSKGIRYVPFAPRVAADEIDLTNPSLDQLYKKLEERSVKQFV